MSGRRGDEERGRREPVRISEVAGEALEQLAGERRKGLITVLGVWHEAVGERIAGVARPRRLNDGILTVEVTSPVWAQELALTAPTIVAAVNRLAGQETVRELRFFPRSDRR